MIDQHQKSILDNAATVFSGLSSSSSLNQGGQPFQITGNSADTRLEAALNQALKNYLNENSSGTSNNSGTSNSAIVPAQMQQFSSASIPQSSESTPSGSSSTPSGTGKTYYVATNGDNNADGSQAHPWKTIQHAVGNPSPIQAGDTVLVQPGTYNEAVMVAKSGTDGNPITLKANGDVKIVDPNPTGGKFEDGTIQTNGQSNLDINGFTIQNSPWAGIALHDGKNITVESNHTIQTGSSGIIALPGSYYGGGDQEVTSSNIKVLNNTIDQANHRYYEGTPDVGAQESLSIWGVDNFEVAGNKVTNGNTEGIDIKVGSRNGSVHDNEVSEVAAISGTSRHGGAAIYIDGSRANEFNIDIYNNNLHDNHADAISIADEISNQGSVSNIKVHNNTMSNNGTLGVNGGQAIDVASDVSGVDIYSNISNGNLTGFTIDGAAYGGSPASGLKIHDNQFLGNKFQNGSVKGPTNNVAIANNTFSGQGTGYTTSGSNNNLQDSSNTYQ